MNEIQVAIFYFFKKRLFLPKADMEFQKYSLLAKNNENKGVNYSFMFWDYVGTTVIEMLNIIIHFVY